MNEEPNSFSKFLVIFVDILGSQSREDFQETYKINKIFHEEFEKNQKNDKENSIFFRKIYTFSDCAYIFYGFKEKTDDEEKRKKLFNVALCNCEPVFLRLLNEKIIFRGGISYGDAYIDFQRSMFFGPAVNEAYKYESEVAVHPRIVIDSFVAEKTKESIEDAEYRIVAKDPNYINYLGANLIPKIPETGDGIIEQDIDGQYIFNYLHLPENNIVVPNIYIQSNDFLQTIIDYCKEQIENNKNYKIIDKYFYLLRFTQLKLNNLLEQ